MDGLNQFKPVNLINSINYYEDEHRCTATAEVEAGAANVYSAAERVVNADTSLKVTKKDAYFI